MAPRAEFDQNIPLDLYVRLRMVCERRAGSLRFAYPAGLLGIGCIALGIWTFVLDIDNWTNISTMAGFMLLGILLVLLFFVILPRRRKAEARRDFETFHALFGASKVTLEADTFSVSGERAEVTESYALMKLCVESRSAFYIIRDRGYGYVFRKSDLSDEARDFLRLTFARKYAKGGA